MSQGSGPSGKLGDVRALAFDYLYVLPGAVDRGVGAPPGLEDAEERLQALTPEQRRAAHAIAVRRLAFQMLFELDLKGGARGDVERALMSIEEITEEAIDETIDLTMAAWEKRGEADKEFRALAPEWPTHRQAGVDRAILRLAHYELGHTKTPPKVAVNEAVELAKHFSTERSPAFVNGLLDKVMKRVAAERAGAQPGSGGAGGEPTP